jgi:endonuclease YncB( thermonuclease family)
VDRHRVRRLAVLVLLAGCTQTSTDTPNTLAPLGSAPNTSSTSTTPATAADVIGYASDVTDGRTFDLQVGQDTQRDRTIAYIDVPPIDTCEGIAARDLLAAIIAGKQVTINSAGLTFRGDINVGLAMIQYGQAAPTADAPDSYQRESRQRPDFNCSNTTTTPAPVIIIRPRPTRPKPTRPPTTHAPDTIPTEAPGETAPPVAQPPQTTQPPEAPAAPTSPAPPVVVTEPATPRTPRTPETPATPPAVG